MIFKQALEDNFATLWILVQEGNIAVLSDTGTLRTIIQY